MKPKLKRKDLLSNDAIWNAVIAALVEYDGKINNKIVEEAVIVYHYYTELESGGHESFFNWQSAQIEKVGVENYMKDLISILEKIDAHEYAMIMKKYGKDMWHKFVALENDEIEEIEFYRVIETANDAYDSLNGKLGKFLEAYFIKIYTELFEIEEE